MSNKENEDNDPAPKRLSKEEFEDLLNDLNSLAAMPTNIPHATVKMTEQWNDDVSDVEWTPSSSPMKKESENNKVPPIKQEIAVEEEEQAIKEPPKERWIDDESSEEMLPILSVTPVMKAATATFFHYEELFSPPKKAIKPIGLSGKLLSPKKAVHKAQTTKNQTSKANAFKPRKRKKRAASFRMDYNPGILPTRTTTNRQQMRQRKYVYNPRRPGIPFGSTPRACNTPLRKNVPAVGLYDVNPRFPTKQRMAINGKIGKAKRFKQEKPKAAPIGCYDLQWTYLKKKTVGCSFGSSNRFNKYNPKRNRNYKQEQRAILAESYFKYEKKSTMRKKGGYMSKSKRFKQSKENIPGPGQYGLVHENNHERLPYSLYSKKN